ncbi:hypothetical protein [Nocardiopsis sp. ATB16-24]|uniref:hypothetical protein n=1 Tax=Nocardiopsis sp. ATB16-24 TaxID=3019555 RepID=UPI002555B0EF|nr:hypothetical protein [Nocardiopsis sp. ATB16-24]
MAQAGEGTRAPRSAWAPLGVAVAAVAALVLLWPLVNALVPGSESVASDEPVSVGSGGGYEASLTFPQEGWSLDVGASHDGQSYRFHRGPVELNLTSVRPVTSPPPGVEELWEGMRRLARASESSARLGEPEVIAAHDGHKGLSGPLESRTQSGTAVVYPSPDGLLAVEMTLAGRDATTADIAAVFDVVRTVSFTEEK